MTVLQLRGPMAFRVLQWCHPMLASWHNEGKLLYPDHHLIWCAKVDSGLRTFLGVFLVTGMPREMGWVYLGRSGYVWGGWVCLGRSGYVQ